MPPKHRPGSGLLYLNTMMPDRK